MNISRYVLICFLIFCSSILSNEALTSSLTSHFKSALIVEPSFFVIFLLFVCAKGAAEVLNADEIFPDDYDNLQPPKQNGTRLLSLSCSFARLHLHQPPAAATAVHFVPPPPRHPPCLYVVAQYAPLCCNIPQAMRKMSDIFAALSFLLKDIKSKALAQLISRRSNNVFPGPSSLQPRNDLALNACFS